MPGQWIAGGETPNCNGADTRCHHPIRRGDRLYISYWHGGFAIVDISDMSKPRTVSTLDWSPPYPCPTHTTLPLMNKIMDRDLMIVTDEEVGEKLNETHNAFLWVVDITEESCRCRSRRSWSPTTANRTSEAASARTNRRSKSTTIFTTSPGSPAACAPWISPIRTSRRKSATTFHTPAKAKQSLEQRCFP